MATPDEIQLQKGTIAPSQTEQTGSQKAVALIDSLISSASLPTGTTINPTLQNVATNELMATSGLTGTTAAALTCLLYTSPSPRDGLLSRMPSSA